MHIPRTPTGLIVTIFVTFVIAVLIALLVGWYSPYFVITVTMVQCVLLIGVIVLCLRRVI